MPTQRPTPAEFEIGVKNIADALEADSTAGLRNLALIHLRRVERILQRAEAIEVQRGRPPIVTDVTRR